MDYKLWTGRGFRYQGNRRLKIDLFFSVNLSLFNHNTALLSTR